MRLNCHWVPFVKSKYNYELEVLHSHLGIPWDKIEELPLLRRQWELAQHWKESKSGACLKCFLMGYVQGVKKAS